MISGAAGLIWEKDAGVNSVQPILMPVVLVPLGSKFEVEAEGEFQGFVSQQGPGGPWNAQYFTSVPYIQLDYIVNKHITLVAGRFETPFNIYNERLQPIWIHNFQDAPLIYPIGTRSTGSSNGGMIRGVAVDRDNWQLNYAAYFSAQVEDEHFGSGRTFGLRSGVFLPKKRLEFGFSYQRFLEDTHLNSYGAYLSWQPRSAPLDVKAEYAHSPAGQGYWIEAAYRFRGTSGKGSFLKNIQPIVRGQQLFHGEAVAESFLPTVDTQRVDFGVNYYLPHEVRVNASYGRQFSGIGDFNAWTVDITYRFLFPMPFWPKGAN